MPYLGELGLNAHVLLAVTIASLVAVVLFAAIPMVRSRRFARDHDVSERSRGNAGRTWSRLGGRLVALELAIAVVLLVGAGLLGRSLYRLSQVDLAFTPDRLATVQIIAPESKYASDAQRAALGREIVKRAAQLPGATGAGVTSVLPVSFNGNTMWIRVAGHPYHGEHDEVNFREVSPGYLPTLGTPLVRGRGFTETDDAAHPRVAIVNEALVRRYFAGEDPVGQRIGDTDLSPDSIREIVGVIADLREGPPDTPTLPAIYYPFSQAPESYFSLVVRAARSDAALLPTLDTLVHRIDPDLGTRDPATMHDHIGRSPAAYLHESAAWMAAGFAAMAWMLGVMGLYGVLAYLVSQRTREIGIRMALGAEPRSVSRLVVREAGVVAAVGIGVGVVAAIGAAVLMRGVLFGTAPWDAPTLAAAVGALGASVLLASYVPARRAAAIDPIDALREE